MDDDTLEEREEQYQDRNEAIRHVIDVLASYDSARFDNHGFKSEVAREHDLERHRIYYVLKHWDHLVSYRRVANTDPLDPDAVKAAYEDDTLGEMAAQRAVADGAGDITIDVEFTLDEVFRAIKLLPGDLGLKVYAQTLGSDLDRGEVRRILESGS